MRKPNLRLAILLGLLGLSMGLYAERNRVRRWLYGAPPSETLVGKAAPELASLHGRCDVLAGPQPSLAALRGRVVLLHFWTFG